MDEPNLLHLHLHEFEWILSLQKNRAFIPLD